MMVTQVEEYLAARRHFGFALEVDGQQLLRFARFADSVNHRGPLTQAIATRWALLNVTRPLTAARRIEVLRPFARYQSQFDSATEIPPTQLFGASHRRLVPHIYTENEIRALLAAAAKLPPAGGLRPATYTTLFGLLAATGLRISEALHLMRSDVDLSAGLLTVRNTKFRKSRLIPLHQTTIKALQSYVRLRDAKIPATAYDDFFLLDDDRRLHKRSVEYQFQKLRTQLRWQSRGDHPAPRIHDLRHTFICHCLLRWYRQGVDVDGEILSLSTYVGHARVTDTYWYITGIPELMAIAARRFEQFVSGDLK
jgi:integrase